MLRLTSLRLALLVALIAGTSAAQSALAQSSEGARWLVQEQIDLYCGGQGRMDPSGVIEADLTGDGRDDLVIYSEFIKCDNDALTCGAVYCSADVYVREVDLLVNKGGFNTLCAELAPGNPPGIRFCDKNGSPWVVRWNGREFAK